MERTVRGRTIEKKRHITSVFPGGKTIPEERRSHGRNGARAWRELKRGRDIVMELSASSIRHQMSERQLPSKAGT